MPVISDVRNSIAYDTEGTPFQSQMCRLMTITLVSPETVTLHSEDMVVAHARLYKLVLGLNLSRSKAYRQTIIVLPRSGGQQ